MRRCHAAYVSARNPWSRQRNVGVTWEFAEIASAAVTGVTPGMQRPSARAQPPRNGRALAVQPKRDGIPTFCL